MESRSDIQNFYKDQTIFITGGTGFIGKVLVEKLLRTCPDLRKIFMLLRSKKGKTAHQRFENLFDYPCFDRLKDVMPDFTKKIQIIDGNCREPQFAISPEDRQMVVKETTIVIHAAADVRLDQPLKTAAICNIKATMTMLELARDMSQLKALVYISTAYTNCPRVNINETFYEPGMKAHSLLSLIDAVDDETLENITPRIIKGWPNAYTFTKCITEDVIKTEGNDLPIAIVRPAIIISSVEEPFRGWIDNFYGLIGLTIGITTGLIKSLYCKKSSPLHCVPCDYVVNNIIVAAWNLGNRREIIKNNDKQKKEIPIYNFVGSNKRVLTMGNLQDYGNELKWVQPLNKMMFWFPVFNFTESLLWHKIRVFFLHTLLSYFIDFILICLNKKPIAVKKFQQVNKLLIVTSFFTTTPLQFETNNVDNLWKDLRKEDQELFHFNMDDFDWKKYWTDSLPCGRVFLLNESCEDIPKGRRKIYVLFVLHYAVQFLIIYFFFKIILRLFS